MINADRLRVGIKKLRLLLVLLTVVQAAYILIYFFYPQAWVKLDHQYMLNKLIWGLTFLVYAIFIRFIWLKMPIEKKVKANHTLLVILFGIIWMWIWLPTEKEINKLMEQQSK